MAGLAKAKSLLAKSEKKRDAPISFRADHSSQLLESVSSDHMTSLSANQVTPTRAFYEYKPVDGLIHVSVPNTDSGSYL